MTVNDRANVGILWTNIFVDRYQHDSYDHYRNSKLEQKSFDFNNYPKQ